MVFPKITVAGDLEGKGSLDVGAGFAFLRKPGIPWFVAYLVALPTAILGAACYVWMFWPFGLPGGVVSVVLLTVPFIFLPGLIAWRLTWPKRSKILGISTRDFTVKSAGEGTVLFRRRSPSPPLHALIFDEVQVNNIKVSFPTAQQALQCIEILSQDSSD